MISPAIVAHALGQRWIWQGETWTYLVHQWTNGDTLRGVDRRTVTYYKQLAFPVDGHVTATLGNPGVWVRNIRAFKKRKYLFAHR